MTNGPSASIFRLDSNLTLNNTNCTFNFANDDHDSVIMWEDYTTKLSTTNQVTTSGSTWRTWLRNGTENNTAGTLPDVPTGAGTSARPIPLPAAGKVVWFDWENTRILWDNGTGNATFSSVGISGNGGMNTYSTNFYFITDGVSMIHLGYSGGSAKLLKFNFNNNTIVNESATLFSPLNWYSTEEDSFGHVLWTVNGRVMFYNGTGKFSLGGNLTNPNSPITTYTVTENSTPSQPGLDFFGRVDLDGFLWFVDWGHDNGGYFNCGNDNYLGVGMTNIQLTTNSSTVNSLGAISTTPGATPFYADLSNPYTLNLTQGQYQIITWTVNATGGINNTYQFSASANKTSDQSINNITEMWNVTITNITGATPSISIAYPLNNINYTVNISSLNYTVTGNNLSRCWYSTNNGASNSTNVQNGTNFTGVISLEGANNWNVYCNNTNGNVSSATTTFNIDLTSPNITLNSPADSYSTSISGSANISFNCSTTDNVALKNISLYITNSSNSNFSINQTTNISGTYNVTNWTVPFGVGNYTWNCLAFDLYGNSNWSTNRTFSLQSYYSPNITLNYPSNNSLLNNKSSIQLNVTPTGYSNNLTIWFFGGYANGSYSLINATYGQSNNSNVLFNWSLGISGRYNWTAVAFDGSTNSTNYTYYFNLTNFSVSCEAGGNYQQGALVLLQGTITNESIVVPSYPVNISLYDSNNNLNTTQSLTTASDGGFKTNFSNLRVGSYSINATSTYRGYNETCTDIFSVGSSASIILDKTLSLNNLSNSTISYNITLRVTNKGGSDATSVILTDNDSSNSPYTLGNISANSSISTSYVKEYIRNSSNYNSSLAIASINATNSYSGGQILVNSSATIITIPASDIAQQLTLVKNAYYNSENSTSANYTISINVVNSGGVDLNNITLIDSDMNLNTIINLNRSQNYTNSSYSIIDKAATNTNKLFVKSNAIINSINYESNQIQVRIPGYGGPADAIVNAPATVSSSASFNTIITVANQNAEVEQDFVVNYWITNEAETENYSSGQQTIYVAASGNSDLTATLSAPSGTGNYRFRALVSWAGGTASSYDSFSVSSSTTSSSSSGSGGSGRATISDPIVCNPPYIRYGKECCIDKNNNNICDTDESSKGSIGNPSNKTTIENETNRETPSNINQVNKYFSNSYNYIYKKVSSLFLNKIVIILIILIIIITIYNFSGLHIFQSYNFLKIGKKNPRMLSSIEGKEVYSERGNKLGVVKEIIIKNNIIYGLVIKPEKVLNLNKKVLIKFENILFIKDIITVQEEVEDYISLKELFS